MSDGVLEGSVVRVRVGHHFSVAPFSLHELQNLEPYSVAQILHHAELLEQPLAAIPK
jgi:hypothetical protein